MDTLPNSVTTKEFQVSGVSRSGRVRKKSSKLLDFQSPDEVEKKPKRFITPTIKPTGRGRGRPSRRALEEANAANDIAGDNEDIDGEDTDANEHLDDDAHQHLGDSSTFAVAPDSEDELDELVADLVEGVEAESMEHVNNTESKVRQSLYMTEKSNKRKMLRDGKVVTEKMERKDKGKSRYTAYSLWAREFRKTSKFSKNQDLDFSSAARRLGELWANVPNKEKSAWRRKAKMQATRAKAREKSIASSNVSMYNRATTSRTRKLSEIQKTPSPPHLHPATNNTDAAAVKRRRNNSYKSPVTSYVPLNVINAQPNNNSINNVGSTFTASTHGNAQLFVNKKSTTMPATEIIDAAAHLKLLGESLSIIGDRLKEHDGQIAVSGSLSVLLDSLLCSLGPLLCLTTHLPGLEKKSQLSANLAATLDNIAYVMPGL